MARVVQGRLCWCWRASISRLCSVRSSRSTRAEITCSRMLVLVTPSSMRALSGLACSRRIAKSCMLSTVSALGARP
jgi:hypothetical protein